MYAHIEHEAPLTWVKQEFQWLHLIPTNAGIVHYTGCLSKLFSQYTKQNCRYSVAFQRSTSYRLRGFLANNFGT